MNQNHILDAARDFRTSSEIIAAQFPVRPIRSEFTSLAMATELYLKYLIKRNNRDFDRTHDIARLYQGLPDLVKDLLTSRWSGTIPLLDFLSKNKNVFVDWRYLFEKQDKSFTSTIGDLRLLVNILESVASE